MLGLNGYFFFFFFFFGVTLSGRDTTDLYYYNMFIELDHTEVESTVYQAKCRYLFIL